VNHIEVTTALPFVFGDEYLVRGTAERRGRKESRDRRDLAGVERNCEIDVDHETGLTVKHCAQGTGDEVAYASSMQRPGE
jgi:hypothetical protein